MFFLEFYAFFCNMVWGCELLGHFFLNKKKPQENFRLDSTAARGGDGDTGAYTRCGAYTRYAPTLAI